MSQELQTHILEKFQIISKIGKGAYGIVWKVVDKKTKKIYSLKKIFDAFQNSTDAQRTYRQISYLKQLKHENIIELQNVIRAENNLDIYLVFQYMEIDLYQLAKKLVLSEKHKKYILYQIAKAIKYLHSANLIHRDIKPSNILLNSDCKTKLCDFGLVRSVNYQQQQSQILTQYIATRWYRAPQILLGQKNYDKSIDIWSFGCLIGQLFKNSPLFPGNSTINQLQKILTFTGYSQQSIMLPITLLQNLKGIKQKPIKDIIIFENQVLEDLFIKMLKFDPRKRLTIQEIIQHPYFEEFHDDLLEPICKKIIQTKIDDGKKLNIKEYRLLIYKQITENVGDSQVQKFKNKKFSIYQSLNKSFKLRQTLAQRHKNKKQSQKSKQMSSVKLIDQQEFSQIQFPQINSNISVIKKKTQKLQTQNQSNVKKNRYATEQNDQKNYINKSVIDKLGAFRQSRIECLSKKKKNISFIKKYLQYKESII